MNDSDKYIIDTFFDTIKNSKDNEPYLYKIFNNEYVDEFYIDLYDKYKHDFVSKTDLRISLKKHVVEIYNIVSKRGDIVDKIINKKIKLIDMTDKRKLIDILKYDRQKNAVSSVLFKPQTASEALKEKLFIGKNLFHPSQLEKKQGKVINEDEKEEKLKKVQNDLSVLFGDKKKPEEIKKLAEKLIEQQPDKVKAINMKLVEDLITDLPRNEKEKKYKLKCKDGKILNKFTNKCVNEDSPVGIFMKSKNATIDEVTKEDLDNYSTLKLDDLKKICKTNAPNISCDNMFTKKELYYHIFNNINIHNNKLLCENGKVYYHDVKECVDKRDATTKIKKSKEKSKKTEKKKDEIEKSKSPPKSYKNVDENIRQQIKENLKKKKPISCKDDEVYNKFTDKCVKNNTMTASFLLSNYGNLNNITKNDLKKFNQLKREDLDKLCKKFSHIGCNFNTKEELARHILDNVRINKNELFCDDNKVYYHDIKKCIDRRLTKKEKEKLKEKENETESKKYKNDKDIYKIYTKMLITDAYQSGFINKVNYKNTDKQIFELIKIIHKDIINKLKKYLKDDEIRTQIEKSKDSYKKLIDEVYKIYFNKSLITDIEMKDFIRDNIFVDVSDKDIDKIYEFVFRDIIIKLLLNDELTLNNELNLNLSFKISSKIIKKKVADLKPSQRPDSFSPDLKKSENIKTIEDISLEMISNGNTDKLLGKKIKKQTTVNYITKLLENMKKAFYKMLDKEKETLTNDNQKYFINKFMNENINNKIDTISDNLISSCLNTMTLDNSRKWLNKYLPISLYKII